MTGEAPKNFKKHLLVYAAQLAALAGSMTEDMTRFAKTIKPMPTPKFKRVRYSHSFYPKPHQGTRERERRRRAFYAIAEHEHEWRSDIKRQPGRSFTRAIRRRNERLGMVAA